HTRLQGDWSSDVCSSDLYQDAVMQRSDIHSHFFDLRSIRYKTSRPILRAENLPILLPRRFEVIRLLFLTLGFSLRPLLFVEFHSFRNGKFSFSIRSLRINDQPQNITERRSHKIEGIL